jgi:hypothetical protein
MKQYHLEAMRRAQKHYHRANPWRLSAGGLYVPHAYWDMTPQSLSYWDDVGFIMNGRRVIVWWQHPRYVYQEAIWDQVWIEVGEGPHDNWLTDGVTENSKPGRIARYRRTATTRQTTSPARVAYYERLNSAFVRMSAQGIDCDVSVACKRNRLWWATGLSLVAPLDVRNEAELASVASLAKRLIRQETTLEREFPGYCYGRQHWLAEQASLRDSANG